MATQVTQCPSCQTSFRVTEAQLTIANGAVRCGSCLHIFNATEHWLDGNRSTATSEPATEQLIEQTPDYDSQPLSGNERSWQSTDDLDTNVLSADSLFSASDQNALDNIFNDDSFVLDGALDEPDYTPQIGEPADRDPTVDIELTDSDTDNNSTKADDHRHLLADSDFVIDGDIQTDQQNSNEDTADAEDDDDGDVLIHDTAAHPIIEIDDGSYDYQDLEIEEQHEQQVSGAFSDNFLDLELENDNAGDAFFSEDIEGGNDQEEAWTKKLLEEDTGEHDPAEHRPEHEQEESPQEELAADQPGLEQFGEYDYNDDQLSEEDTFDESLFETHDNIFDSLQEEPEQPLDPELFDILDEHDSLLESESPEDEFILGDEPMLAGDHSGPNSLDLLANIEPEPVVFANRSDRSLWVKRGWSIGTAAALLLLFAQYIVFNFDRLSRDQSYRPVFASACPLLGCTLPNLDNIKLIRSTNLMVRSHPDYQNALVVDAIISNRASFQQRFPSMELQFTNLAGEIVAGRQFKPSEYLAGELKGSSTMPINQPIHVSLEIVDPGQQAVSYQLRLHPQSEG